MKNMLRPFPLLCILALLWGNTNHNTLTAQTNCGRQGDWSVVNNYSFYIMTFPAAPPSRRVMT